MHESLQLSYWQQSRTTRVNIEPCVQTSTSAHFIRNTPSKRVIAYALILRMVRWCLTGAAGSLPSRGLTLMQATMRAIA